MATIVRGQVVMREGAVLAPGRGKAMRFLEVMA
jgi:hypothetical protein